MVSNRWCSGTIQPRRCASHSTSTCHSRHANLDIILRPFLAKCLALLLCHPTVFIPVCHALLCDHAARLRLCCGCAVTVPWLCCGCAVAVLWPCCDCDVTVLWHPIMYAVTVHAARCTLPVPNRATSIETQWHRVTIVYTLTLPRPTRPSRAIRAYTARTTEDFLLFSVRSTQYCICFWDGVGRHFSAIPSTRIFPPKGPCCSLAVPPACSPIRPWTRARPIF